MAKSSEKALVKRFCEKNFTEFLSDLKNGRRFLSSPSFIEITKVEQDFYIKQATNMIE
ncbi:MAG: hypothetical protein IKB25_03005 [Lentisphaeria bacterium]|nr:hypothetical protein [Lentisphaeria bacterium]